MDILSKIVNADPAPPRRYRPGVPKELETICLKCLEKEPGRRYQTAEELGADLERFLGGEAVLARPPSFPVMVARRIRKHRFAALAAVAILAAVIVTALVVSSRAQEESEHITEQLTRLKARVSSMTKRDNENRSGLVKEIEEILRTGSEEEKDQARGLLKTLGVGPGAVGPSAVDSASSMLALAERFAKANPADTDEALERFAAVRALFPDTAAGIAAGKRAEELRQSRSDRMAGRFAETASKANRLIAKGRPGAAVKAWKELIPGLSDEQLASEAVSQMQGILLREVREYFDAWTGAEAFAGRGDFPSAEDQLKPFTSSDLDDIRRLADLSVTRYVALRAEWEKEGKSAAPAEVVVSARGAEEEERRTGEFMARLSEKVSRYDFDGARRLWEDLLKEVPDSTPGGGPWARFTDYLAAENLWSAFRLFLFEGRGSTEELSIEGTGGNPLPRKV
jgi:hypothetical protein